MRNNDFNDIVFNRRSIKAFDPNVKISREEMNEILREATTAPSSINMQPWRFIVVESEKGKEKLRPLVMTNTRQNDTSAAMILIFGDLKCYEKAEEIYGMALEKGYITQEIKEKQLNVFVSWYENLRKEKMNDIVKIDCSLAAMQLMLVARAHGYDTNAIGGFEQDKIAEAFGLDPNRYVPVMIVAIGKSDYVNPGSVRLNINDVTTFE